MSLQGIPGMTESFRSFVQMVRLYMRDFPEINRVVTGEESTDRQIAWAVLDAISDFNGTPHRTNLSLEELLAYNQHALLLRMTVISLIESIGLFQMRNHLNYSTGGTNVGVNDKSPLIANWLQYFKSYTDQMKQRVKVSLNIEGAMGCGGPSGVHSEYWAINASYAAFS
jgi:hypothetical protein